MLYIRKFTVILLSIFLNREVNSLKECCTFGINTFGINGDIRQLCLIVLITLATCICNMRK